MINGADTTEVGNVSLAEKKKQNKTKQKQSKAPIYAVQWLTYS